MVKRYPVHLTEAARTRLLRLVGQGTGRAKTIRRAYILLLADEGQSDSQIAAALHVSVSTIQRTRRRCAQGGVEAALLDRSRPGAQRRLDADQEALLLRLARSEPPAGCARWTPGRLAVRLVELGVVERISRETVRQVLRRHRFRR